MCVAPGSPALKTAHPFKRVTTSPILRARIQSKALPMPLKVFELFASQDDSAHVAIHAEDERRQPINVRIPATGLDDVNRFGGGLTTAEQRRRS